MNRDYDIYLGVPCSGWDYKSDIPCTREDEAIAIAFGCYLCGKKPKVFMQNSGWGNCLDVITSLWMAYVPDNEYSELDISVMNRNEPEHHLYMATYFLNTHEELNNVFNAVRSTIKFNEEHPG
jgi:hypothetical protein